MTTNKILRHRTAWTKMPLLSNFAPRKKTGILWVTNSYIKIILSRNPKTIVLSAKSKSGIPRKKSWHTRRKTIAFSTSISRRAKIMIRAIPMGLGDLIKHTIATMGTLSKTHPTTSADPKTTITGGITTSHLQRTATNLTSTSPNTW